jgi:hypothetical protein
MLQLLLFDDCVNKETANKRLQRYVASGLKFLNIAEVSSILDLTFSQVRNAIYLYRLDALLIGGVYRIPWFSITKYINEKSEITRQFFAYKRYIEEHEIDGILEYHRLINTGTSKEKATEVIKSKNKYISDEILQDIDNLDIFENKETIEDPRLIDWYELNRLNIPFKISIATLSELLRIPLKSLIEDTKIDLDCCVIEWPEVYDLLIAKEMINLPVEYRSRKYSLNEESEDQEAYKQLKLF